MSKGNRSLAAKVKKNYNVYKDRDMKGDQYLPKYDQGSEAYRDGYPMSRSWHPHKQQGWKAERDRDYKFYHQCSKISVKKSIMARICKALELNESEFLQAV